MLAVLPTRARLKVSKWQAAVSDGDALLGSLRERRDSAENSRALAVRRLAGAKRDRYGDAARLKQLETEVESADAVLAAVYREGQQRMAARDRSRFLSERCLEWLRVMANEGVTADDGPRWRDADLDAKPEDGQSFEEAVAATRHEIYDLQRQIGKLNSAPPPRDEIRAAVIAEVDRMANAGAPRLDASNGRARVVWPDDSQYAPSAPARSASSMLCWMHRTALRDWLLAAVDRIDEFGLPFDERAPREQELRAEIRVLEMREEALIELAEQTGISIERRRDVPIEALLLLAPKVVETETALLAAE